MPIITSPHNDRIKLIHALTSAGKTRRAEQKIVLEGTRLIADALDSGAQPTFALYTADALEAGKADLHERLTRQGVECLEVSAEIMQYASDTQSPQGWLAVFPMPELDPPSKLNFVLVLDGLADPGNMGTILRTAAAASVDLVVLAPYCVDPFNPKVLRGGMGAHFRIPIRRHSWSDIAERYTALAIYLADARAEMQYTSVDWTQPSLLIIGGEAHGPEASARNLAGQSIAIPMAERAESLNAAVATGVILFEAQRQRLSR